jgi:hypothetical protein
MRRLVLAPSKPSTDVDIDFLFEWIYENVPAHFTDPHDLAEAWLH